MRFFYCLSVFYRGANKYFALKLGEYNKRNVHLHSLKKIGNKIIKYFKRGYTKL